MPAYSSMPRFVDPIRAKIKGGTIRHPRRAPNGGFRSMARQTVGGHAYAGEVMALYCRRRHPRGFLIAHVCCVDVTPILLRFDIPAIQFPIVGRVISRPELLDAFSRFDGFADFDDMRAFWREAHGPPPEFTGWHIRWLSFPPAFEVLDA